LRIIIIFITNKRSGPTNAGPYGNRMTGGIKKLLLSFDAD